MIDNIPQIVSGIDLDVTEMRLQHCLNCVVIQLIRFQLVQVGNDAVHNVVFDEPVHEVHRERAPGEHEFPMYDVKVLVDGEHAVEFVHIFR